MPPFPTAVAVFSLLLLLRPAAASATEPTIYDVLRDHGLPAGLLPKGVHDFSIDGAGNFEVWLDKPCTARFENDVRYEANVSGTISYGQIAALKGVSAQELFMWFPVKGIRVDVPSSGIIYFDVGVIYKQFSLSLFEVPPECHQAFEDLDQILVLLREGEEIASAVAKSKSGKLRYMLDNKITDRKASV